MKQFSQDFARKIMGNYCCASKWYNIGLASCE